MATPVPGLSLGEDLVLTRLTLEDVPTILAIEAASFRHPWKEAFFRAELSRGDIGNQMGARVQSTGALIAYCFYWRILDEMHVLNVAVHPDYRRRGLGRRMLEAVLAEGAAYHVARVFLDVRASNEAAVRLYERLGFRRVGRRPRYYQDGEDALVMARILD